MTNTTKTVIALIVLVLLAFDAYYLWQYAQINPSNPPESTAGQGTVCAMDAKLCPDGTYVGRTGPNCEFVCPGVGTTSANSVPVVNATVNSDGTVTVSPADVGK